MTNINPNTPMEDLTIGGNIYTAGNAKELEIGEVQSLFFIVINVNNVVCAFLFAQMMQFQ